jgi:hypothetical protein
LFEWIQPFQGWICFGLSTRRRPIASTNTGLNDAAPLELKTLRQLRSLSAFISFRRDRRAKIYAVGNGLRSEKNF